MAGKVTQLGGTWNFRDVADSVAALQPGWLYRSGDLSELDDAGQRALQYLGIADIADLRSAREMSHLGPGRVPDDVAIHLLPFSQTAAEPNTLNSDAPPDHAFLQILTEKHDPKSLSSTMAHYLVSEYQRFPTLAGAQNAVRQVISLLGTGRPVLVNCFAGKDRTGFVVATVLKAIGVDREAVFADYLRSNTGIPQLRSRFLRIIRDQPEAFPAAANFTESHLSDEFLGVREQYLTTAWDSIAATHGSLENYLHSAGITASDIAQLRETLIAS